MNSFCPAVV
jgi:THO complex subunit 4